MNFLRKNPFDEIRIINTPSKFIEIIGIINGMVEEENYRYDKTLIEEAKKNITKNSTEILGKISKLRLKGLEMIEFLVVLEEFNDVEKILSMISTLDNTEYLYRFFGEDIDKQAIKDVLKGNLEINRLIKDEPWFRENDIEILNYLFYDTLKFRASVERLIREVDNKLTEEKLAHLKTGYLLAMDEIKQSLKEMTPLNVAQEIMGKEFKRVYDFSRYIFTPSYFINRKHIRIFNKSTQIQIYNIGEEAVDDLDKIVKLLKTFSDSTRLEILRRLSKDPDYGREIAEKMDLSPATISHHLEQLRAIGVINEERIRNVKYYSTNPKEVKKLLSKIERYILG